MSDGALLYGQEERALIRELVQEELRRQYADLTRVDGVLAGRNVAGATATTPGTVVLGNDFGGTRDSPVVTGIQDFPVSGTDPTNGQALVFDGAQYAPVDIATQTELNALPVTLSSAILVDDAYDILVDDNGDVLIGE